MITKYFNYLIKSLEKRLYSRGFTYEKVHGYHVFTGVNIIVIICRNIYKSFDLKVLYVSLETKEVIGRNILRTDFLKEARKKIIKKIDKYEQNF